MASPQNSRNWQVGSSFSIENLLNLSEDESNRNGRVNQAQVQAASANRPPTVSHDNYGHYIPQGQPFTASLMKCAGTRRGLPNREAFLGGSSPYTNFCQRRPMCKTSERRLFLPYQVQSMEKEFNSKKYLMEGRRAELAVELKLTETQVKTWFQNRRTKWRKKLRNENPPREVPDGRLKHSILFTRRFPAHGHPTNPTVTDVH